MNLTLAEIARAAGAAVPDGSERVVVGDVCTDTRELAPGSVFVALRGERFDGHDYLEDAFAAGAVAVVVEPLPGPPLKREPLPGPPLKREGEKRRGAAARIVVSDTREAYGRIAAYWRSKFDIPVIAVTGSVGKTTTKELCALALSPLGPVLRTEKNENNEIGLPKTLLRLSPEHKAVVLEMGMRAPGEIDYLARIAQPTIGIVTIIGESHIELLGSREAIADAKGELLARLPRDGAALINVKDDFAGRLRSRSSAARVFTFGDGAEADYRMENAERVNGNWKAQVRLPGGYLAQFHLASVARHDCIAATSAIGAATLAGVHAPDAAAALAAFVPGAMRMEMIRLSSGATVISDCYNAAPTSMRAALDTLAGLSTPGSRRIAILGDMKELGSHGEQMHQQVGAYAEALGIDEVYVVGPEFGKLSHASQRFASSDEAADYARQDLDLRSGDVVLVKGSRAMAMENVVDALVKP